MTAQRLLAHARDLEPTVRDAAEETERTGTLPASLVTLLRDSGLFAVLVPQEVGARARTC